MDVGADAQPILKSPNDSGAIFLVKLGMSYAWGVTNNHYEARS